MRHLSLILFITLLFAFPASSQGQVEKVVIGVNGLTCSACTKSVEMKIRKLQFVQDVKMNLEHTQGEIHFKPNVKVEFDKIAQAVYDAGFSVRDLRAIIKMEANAASDKCIRFLGDTFIVLERKNSGAEETHVIMKFIGEKFLLTKEYNTWKPRMNTQCENAIGKIYYVML